MEKYVKYEFDIFDSDEFQNIVLEKEKIDDIEIEESYTSKCSFIDNESIEKHEEYLGQRIKRGLFKSKNGNLINSDINGSYNIMRKYLKCNRNAVMPTDAGFVYNPIKINL